MFVNYKSIYTKSRPDAPDLRELLEDLHVNSTMCFPSAREDGENDIDDYIERIIGYLHHDLEARGSSSSSSYSSLRTTAKRPKRSISINGVRFRLKPEFTQTSTRWELFVIVNDKKKVDASCLVEFNDIYQTCEIHEVCVATPRKGYCKELITRVRDHIAAGSSGPMREIRIYCEKSNPAACACYSRIFENGIKIITPASNAFVYQT